MKRKKLTRGFTLLEALIGLALLSFLMLGTGEAIAHALAVKKKVDDRQEACSQASAKLEELKSLSFESPEIAAGEYADEFQGTSSAGLFARKWRIEDVGPNLKRVEISVWRQGRPERKIRIALLISRELEF